MIVVTNTSLYELAVEWMVYIDDFPDRPHPTLLSQCDVSGVTSFASLFNQCPRAVFDFPGNDIGGWTFGSKPIKMTYMFEFCDYVPEAICQWDVSCVVSMRGMFMGCQNMNLPLGQWNVANVTDFSCMFEKCTRFNQPLGNWNVSNAITMDDMFKSAISFNQPLTHWQVNKVTKMSCMFENANAFNQSLATWKPRPECRYLSMLGARRFNNYPPNFQSNLRMDASHAFIGQGDDFMEINAEILTTYNRAKHTNPYMRRSAEESPTVGDVIHAVYSHVLFFPALVELFLVDEVAAYGGILQDNPLYETIALEDFRRRVLDLVGVAPNLRMSLSAMQRLYVTKCLKTLR